MSTLRQHAVAVLAAGVVGWSGVALGAGGTTDGAATEGFGRHWAFQPVADPPVPRVRDESWPRTSIDRFVLGRLEAEGLRPVPAADRRTLLRRVTFDLTGLPPTPDEIEAFEADRSEDALARVVERLLASPRYGERWGRHWMDVVRYADTAGDNADYPIPEIHLYRDYIIDSFNADKPFDQFVREQIAGDILAGPGGDGRRADQIVATGFLALSRRYGTGPYELWHLTLENTMETVGQAFLGLNLKCARCHDHKFDPVTMQDYYGLYGIFASTEFPWAGSEEIQSKNFNRQKFVPLVSESEAAGRMQAWRARQEALRVEIERLETSKPEGKEAQDARGKAVAALKRELRALEKPGAPADVPVAYAVREGKAADVALQRRGEPAAAGAIVPRCAPAFLPGGASLGIREGSSGRLEFAQWLTRADNPLTARVMVNRIWQYHFGRGLVATPNNLGLRSEPPAHRELLDHLAARFVAGGWSVKALHRLILSSAAYQLSSAGDPENLRRDPANLWHWRFERRRLDAEAIRDAMLAVSGRLELKRPGRHPFPPPEKWTWTQHTPFKELYDTPHRSVYLMTQRLQKHPFLALFDGPDTNNSTESRRTSIVPQQALYVLNHPFVDEQARHLARRVCAERVAEAERLDRLSLLTWGRPLTALEQSRQRQRLARMRELAGEAGIEAGRREEEAWTSLARVAISVNEFFHVD